MRKGFKLNRIYRGLSIREIILKSEARCHSLSKFSKLAILISTAVMVSFLAVLPAFGGQFTYSATKRVFKVCNLLVDSARYNPNDPNSPPENSDPYVFYILDKREDLKPYGWELVNPLAPTTVSPEIAYRWNYGDRRDPTNPYYVGQPVTKNMACYWEVLLSEVSVEDLLQFDLVFITNHRQTTFSPQDLEKLRRFVDAGGHLWIDDCSGFRITDNNFITPLQFANDGPAGQAVVVDPYHPLLSYPFQLTYDEISHLGDKNVGNYYISVYNPAVLQPVVLNYASGRTDKPYVAGGQFGSGLIIATSGDVGCDINDPCGGRTTSSGQNSGPYAGENIENAHSEDIKFVWNMILWASVWSAYRKDTRRSALSFEEITPPLDLKWQFTKDSFTYYSPTVWNGIVVTVSDNGVVYAFDLDPYRDIDNDGNPDDGVPNSFDPILPYDLLWSYNSGTPPSPTPNSPLITTIWDGNYTIEVAIVAIGNQLVCLPLYPPNPLAPAPLWTRNLAGPIRYAPSLVRGALIVGAGAELYCIDPKTGQNIGVPFLLQNVSEITTSITAAAGEDPNIERIVVGTTSASGQGSIRYLVWNWGTGQFESRGTMLTQGIPVGSIIFTPENQIIFVTNDANNNTGWVYCAYWRSTSPFWRYNTGRLITREFSPAVSYKHDLIYVATPNAIFAFSLHPTFRAQLHNQIMEGSLPFVRYVDSSDSGAQQIATRLGINIVLPPTPFPPRYDFNPQTGEIFFNSNIAMLAPDTGAAYLLRIDYSLPDRTRVNEYWLISDYYPVQSGNAWVNGYAGTPNCFVVPSNLIWWRTVDLDMTTPLAFNCAPVVFNDVVYVGGTNKLYAFLADSRVAKLGDRIPIIDIQTGAVYETTNSYSFNEETLQIPAPQPPIIYIQKPFPGGIMASQTIGQITNLAGANRVLMVSFNNALVALQQPLFLIADNRGVAETAVDFGKVDDVGRASGELHWSIDSVNWTDSNGIVTKQPLNYPQLIRQLDVNSFLIADSGNRRLIITNRGGSVNWEVADFGWANFLDPNGMLAGWEQRRFGQISDAYRWTFPVPDPTNPNNTIIRYHTLVADPDNFRIINFVEEWNAGTRQWVNRAILWATRTQRESKQYRFSKIYPIETIQDPTHPQAGAIWRAWAVISNYALAVDYDATRNVHIIQKEEPGVSIVMINRDYENEPLPSSMGIVYSFTKVVDTFNLLPTTTSLPDKLYKISAINSLTIGYHPTLGTEELMITGTLTPITPPGQEPLPPIVGVFKLALPSATFDPTSPPIPPNTPLELRWCYLASDWLLTNPAGRHSPVLVDERHFLPSYAKMLATGEYLISLAHPSASEVIMVREDRTMLWAMTEMAEPQEKQRSPGFEPIRRYYRIRQPVFVDTLKGGVM
ncbi:PQQ-binding-like beta-propeller repeat protein [bacterium]|nr:PQQ-binding-like beta-propeller repeat protein [bacterium]